MTTMTTMTATNERMKTMTESRAPKRDKHPARSARILTTGLALSSTLGLSAGYTLAAQAKALNENSLSTPAVAVDPALVPAGSVAQSPAVAPTAPAAAAPLASQSNNQVTPGSAVAVQTPVSAAAPQDAATIVIQVPVAAAPVAAAPAPVVTVAPKTSSSK
jgi:hypothetical protein